MSSRTSTVQDDYIKNFTDAIAELDENIAQTERQIRDAYASIERAQDRLLQAQAARANYAEHVEAVLAAEVSA